MLYSSSSGYDRLLLYSSSSAYQTMTIDLRREIIFRKVDGLHLKMYALKICCGRNFDDKFSAVQANMPRFELSKTRKVNEFNKSGKKRLIKYFV